MKIIKSSKEATKQTLNFKCEKCGCEFECENDEYWDSQTNSLTWFAGKKYMTCCPECHKVVEDTAYNSYYYTCTSDSANIATVKSDIANVTLTGNSFSDCKKK